MHQPCKEEGWCSPACQLQSSGVWNFRDLVCLKSGVVKAKTEQIQQPALWLGESSCTAAVAGSRAGVHISRVALELPQYILRSRLPFVLWLQQGQFVWIPGWMAIYPSQEPNNIVVEGVRVSTCCRSPLLHISGMFANFETFQTMVNNTILFPSSVFGPKGKEKQNDSQISSGFPR